MILITLISCAPGGVSKDGNPMTQDSTQSVNVIDSFIQESIELKTSESTNEVRIDSISRVGSSLISDNSEVIMNDVDTTPSFIDQKETYGSVVYKIPDTMKVGQSYLIELRISKYNTISLTSGLPVDVISKPIRIGKTMETRLISLDDAFDIKTDNTPTQTIEMDSCFTDWVWFVTPTKSGDHYLRLLIVIKEDNLIKDIPVYEGTIHVKSSPIWSSWEFIKEYWQWILGSIVFPIFGWWFINKVTKKKASTKPRKKRR